MVRRVKLRTHCAETLLKTPRKRWEALGFVLSLTIADKEAHQIHTSLHIMLHTSDNVRGPCPGSVTTSLWVQAPRAYVIKRLDFWTHTLNFYFRNMLIFI